MKEYYRKNINKTEKQLELLFLGFEIKIKETSSKLVATKDASEKMSLVEELLDLAEVIKETKEDYKNNLKRYKEECEKGPGNNEV